MKNLYLGRTAFGAYEFGTNKRDWNKTQGFYSFGMSVSVKIIHKFTNIHLYPGQLVRVKSITLDVEAVKGGRV